MGYLAAQGAILAIGIVIGLICSGPAENFV